MPQLSHAGSRKPVSWIENLGVDDLVKLAFAVVEVNAGFFIQKVLPAVESGMQAMNLKLDGQRSILNSAAPE